MNRKIAVIGLGYVGLPLVIAFGRKGAAIGFDVNAKRVEELQSGYDRTGEVSPDDLKETQAIFTCQETDLAQADFYIVAVPTPINSARQPDLEILIRASETIGRNLSKDAIVVYESTVYPGVTEEVCVPVIEKASGMTCGVDFKVGYLRSALTPAIRNTRWSASPRWSLPWMKRRSISSPKFTATSWKPEFTAPQRSRRPRRPK